MPTPKIGNNRGNAGKGRPKGAGNKVTTEVKEMVAVALHNKGGVKYFEKQADENPVAFMALVGKIIPLQLNADHRVNVIDRDAAQAEVEEIFGPTPHLIEAKPHG